MGRAVKTACGHCERPLQRFWQETPVNIYGGQYNHGEDRVRVCHGVVHSFWHKGRRLTTAKTEDSDTCVFNPTRSGMRGMELGIHAIPTRKIAQRHKKNITQQETIAENATATARGTIQRPTRAKPTTPCTSAWSQKLKFTLSLQSSGDRSSSRPMTPPYPGDNGVKSG